MRRKGINIPVFAHMSARELLERIHDRVHTIQQAFEGEPQDGRGHKPHLRHFVHNMGVERTVRGGRALIPAAHHRALTFKFLEIILVVARGID